MIQGVEVGVGEVAEALLARVRAARLGLAAAVAAEDPYAAAVAQDELDDAVRFARRHGLDVEVGGANEE
ncbi:hypothetical protein ADK57_08265 [Streptomyces sp. MMG1533]|uniref:hypothetical protein n=1 Tax=Streptomyces sp. MMG1533 TaxID=1415546 RepID=UPI0006C2B687|nr:hypothetical protein [Streptomyces sp. MMG1533]KOU74164.1 hypothetical protein ADK57_08265 [Streptomyces sp. MMG1533]